MSDGFSREKAPVERFQRRRGSGASSLIHCKYVKRNSLKDGVLVFYAKTKSEN